MTITIKRAYIGFGIFFTAPTPDDINFYVTDDFGNLAELNDDQLNQAYDFKLSMRLNTFYDKY